jgi:hypothetical protein
MQIYRSIEDITVYIFFEILKTDNYRLLIVDDKSTDKITDTELQDIFKNIIYEYSSKTNNFKISSDFKKKIIISLLENEYDILSGVLKIFNDTEAIEVLFILDDLGYNFKNCDSLDLELKKVIAKVKGLKNKINIYKIRYNKANKNNKTNNNDTDYNLDSIAFSLERALDLKYKLDIRETTMIRWINMTNQSKKK